MKLSFHGAVRGVTGSCYLLETEQSKILIDCGAFQGGKKNEKFNFEKFNFDISKIDAVIVTHAHFDHVGRLPVLIKKGFKGKIYMTPPTKELAMIVLEDSAHLIASKAKRYGDKILFDLDDVNNIRLHTSTVNYHTKFNPVSDISITFKDAGHILGSSFVLVEAEDKKIIFSGDIGNKEIPILRETEKLEDVDYILVESTYGNRDHEPAVERSKKLLYAISSVVSRGGTLIIPSFSIERTQELLYEIDQLVDEKMIIDVPVYLDSPLAIKATSIYRQFSNFLKFDRNIFLSPDHDFFSFPRLKETLNVDSSKAINNNHHAKIIIAGSGMMTGGRVLHHLKRYLSDEKSGVLIIGYQAEGTLGRKIFNGAKSVKIFGDKINVKASINAIGSFSAHADRNKLADWLHYSENTKTIFLVHGDVDTKKEFKTFLNAKITNEIVIPKFEQVVEL